jgi:cytochrome P450
MSTTPVSTDLESFAFWARDRPERETAFRWLREHDPVSWHPPAESLLLPPELNTNGFWSIVKHEHIREISRQPKLFSSAAGVFMEDLPPEATAMLSFLTQDAPGHTQLRGIVQAAFSPRNMRTMEGWIADVTRQVVGELAARGQGDLVHELTKPLPGQIYSHYIGAADDEQLRDRVIWAADRLVSWNDPEYTANATPLEVFANAAQELGETAVGLCHKRRESPVDNDDLISWVLDAEFDGRHMTDAEIAHFFVLLGGAANDTVGHTMAFSFLHFDAHPEQLELLREDFDGRIDNAVEECIRMSTPVLHFRRTALHDYEIAGKQIKRGDKVVLWYYSGSRDEDVFQDAHRFDILRPNANRHQAFGGGGPHFCIGSSLARSLLKAVFREVYVNQMPGVRLGEPEFVASNFMNNVKRLPAAWTPAQSGT